MEIFLLVSLFSLFLPWSQEEDSSFMIVHGGVINAGALSFNHEREWLSVSTCKEDLNSPLVEESYTLLAGCQTNHSFKFKCRFNVVSDQTVIYCGNWGYSPLSAVVVYRDLQWQNHVTFDLKSISFFDLSRLIDRLTWYWNTPELKCS